MPPPSCFSPACTSARPHCLYCHLYRRLTRRTYIKEQDPKRVYYMSMEFLMGRSLLNALNNLGIKDQYTEAITELGYKLEILVGWWVGGWWQGVRVRPGFKCLPVLLLVQNSSISSASAAVPAAAGGS